jgi:hypothetical protein
MRTTLLSDLATVGYEIFLEGDHVKLRYQKPDNPPDTVRPLIDELRKCKSEVVNILKTSNAITPTEKTQPRAIVKAIWPSEVQVLMDWFMKLETPTEPFYLEPHRRVIDPEKFFVSLQNEIAIGPSCPRNRTGALLCDLKILKKFLH